MSMPKLVIIITMFLTQLDRLTKKAFSEVPLMSQPPTPHPSNNVSRFLGHDRVRGFTLPLFLPLIQMQKMALHWSLVLGCRQCINYFTKLDGAFWQNLPHILRNHIETKNFACGTNETLIQF